MNKEEKLVKKIEELSDIMRDLKIKETHVLINKKDIKVRHWFNKDDKQGESV